MFGTLGISNIPHQVIAPMTFKDQENYVSGLLRDLDEGILALLYQTLYATGYWISTVEPQIRALKRRLSAPSS